MIATVTLNPSLDEWVDVPALRVGELNRSGSFMRYAGGKGINVSRVVHELRGRTLAFGIAGGVDGQILRKLVDDLGIPHDFASVAGSTRNNYKILAENPRSFTEINTPGPRVSAKVLAELKRRVFGGSPVRRSSAKVLALSGSLPPGAPPGTYAEWIRFARRRLLPAVLDGSGEALRLGIAERPWLIKPNRSEAAEILGKPIRDTDAAVKAALALRQRGPEKVVLSLGADGALLVCGEPVEVWHAASPGVRVISAVGAGDSLVGGLLQGWVSGRSITEAFRLGVACGAATAMTPGTELCHRKDIERLLPEIRLSRVHARKR